MNLVGDGMAGKEPNKLFRAKARIIHAGKDAGYTFGGSGNRPVGCSECSILGAFFEYKNARVAAMDSPVDRRHRSELGLPGRE